MLRIWSDTTAFSASKTMLISSLIISEAIPAAVRVGTGFFSVVMISDAASESALSLECSSIGCFKSLGISYFFLVKVVGLFKDRDR